MMLEIAINEAEVGKKIIENLVTDYMKNYVVLVFPDEDKEVLESAFKYYKRFIKDYEYIYFLSSIDINKFVENTNIPYEVRQVTKEEMKKVISYLSVVTFPSVKIISLKMPEHIEANRLIGQKNTTIDDIVVRCLYGMKGNI